MLLSDACSRVLCDVYKLVISHQYNIFHLVNNPEYLYNPRWRKIRCKWKMFWSGCFFYLFYNKGLSHLDVNCSFFSHHLFIFNLTTIAKWIIGSYIPLSHCFEYLKLCIGVKTGSHLEGSQSCWCSRKKYNYTRKSKVAIYDKLI